MIRRLDHQRFPKWLSATPTRKKGGSSTARRTQPWTQPSAREGWKAEQSGQLRRRRRRRRGRAAAAEVGEVAAAGGGGEPCRPRHGEGRAAERPGLRPSPSPHPGEGSPAPPPQPLGGLLHCTGRGTRVRPSPLPQSRMFTHQGALGTRGRSADPEGPRRPSVARAGPVGEGPRWGLGWGWGPGLCPLSPSPLPLQSHRPKPDPIGQPGSRRGAGSPSRVL